LHENEDCSRGAFIPPGGKNEKGVRLKDPCHAGNKSKGSAVYRENWQERSVLDQADFTQTVTPHLDEAYYLARWVSRGDDRPQKGKPPARRMDRNRTFRYESHASPEDRFGSFLPWTTEAELSGLSQ
jgi:hypothetical protein